MEMMRLRNLRSVTTSVTVRDVHSVVRMNTPRMHTYLNGYVKAFKVHYMIKRQSSKLHEGGHMLELENSVISVKRILCDDIHQ